MSNRDRKARKRAGIQFVKPQKVGTPVAERAEYQPRLVLGMGVGKRLTRVGLPKAIARRLKERGGVSYDAR